ncbi:hypothetical protein K491DRAFT_722189 [Lophiostoma macrostomum CBS 122681]|uniref:Uncharacterized protein n=1 Tax=Lophiostoma macrostomum CBS 122681 TaxID=1314788 RepID=A0A6A6SMN7_9PLEO|nr:hypothetical protein K491DRAFT_722189 [Lophiostoma macrostomum CBS 122681]
MPPFIDEIDLTMSPSPEPKPEPRPRPAIQQTPRGRISQSGSRVAIKPVRLEIREETRNRVKAGSMPTRRPQAPKATPAQPRVNSVHLAHIINSSDTRALRSVLIELCKCSPALSGAVVRGLAPHSSFAQSLIRQHAKPTTLRSTVKQERDISPLSDSGSSDLVFIQGFGSGVKKERSASPALSDGSSSGAFSDHIPLRSNRMPGEFPRPPSPKIHGPAPHYRSDAQGSKPSLSRGPRTGNFPPVTPKKPPMKVCKNCNETFIEGSGSGCDFHPGRKVKASDDAGQSTIRYTCCDGDQWDAPCQSGDHVGRTVSALDSLKRERSNSDRVHIPDRSLKNPKLR